MIQKVKNILRANYVNMKGWSSKRKILLIESDDWGAIKMPSNEVYQKLKATGIPVDSNYFAKYDSLETEKDLEDLFNVLSSFKDINGAHLCITANTIVANPDFKKIKDNNFEKYEYELFTESYKRYGQDKAFGIWQDGIKEHLLFPQFHGREHINPHEWLKVLRHGDKSEILAFDNEVLLGLENANGSQRFLNYTGAFNFESKEEEATFQQIISEGITHFKNIFGFESTSFVAPCGIKNDNLDEVLFNNGVKYFQVGRQLEPDGHGGVVAHNRFWGDTNSRGQIYWRRNGTFEPSRDWNFNWEDSIMKEAEYAFRWGKPLVLNSHRVNYSGGVDPKNRENTLRLLTKIVKKLQSKYPDLEFMSSDQLGDFIMSTKK